jgi:hypothetical protein
MSWLRRFSCFSYLFARPPSLAAGPLSAICWISRFLLLPSQRCQLQRHDMAMNGP